MIFLDVINIMVLCIGEIYGCCVLNAINIMMLCIVELLISWLCVFDVINIMMCYIGELLLSWCCVLDVTIIMMLLVMNTVYIQMVFIKWFVNVKHELSNTSSTHLM
jgi:hypothetical protein